MRILQLIDTLSPGGAERMAVNYANALAEKIEFSGLVATRAEGNLKNDLNTNVRYAFLNKKKTIDFNAIFKLRNYIVTNKVNFIHAHGTSFFTAFLLKMVYPKIKLIWHDHYGDSEFLSQRPSFFLKLTIPFFYGIIAVNQQLQLWSKHQFKLKDVMYLKNFVIENDCNKQETILKGTAGKRIICVANLRPQKNHILLLKIARSLQGSHPDWTIHLIGKDFHNEYSRKIKNLINNLQPQSNTFFYGEQQDINYILSQSEIAILTSLSEGLPLCLLEYGQNKKAVIATDVGEISSIIINQENGILVSSNDEEVFFTALQNLIENENLRIKFGNNLKETITNDFSKEFIIEKYLAWLKGFT